jgi:hypothetical protein
MKIREWVSLTTTQILKKTIMTMLTGLAQGGMYEIARRYRFRAYRLDNIL